MSDRPAQSHPTDPFIAEAERAIRRLQGALGELLDALPSRPNRPQHLTELLQIDQKLSWRIANTIQCTDPFAASQYIPGRAAFRKFIDAAQSAGAATDHIHAAESAFADYEQLTATHAGDRASLEMMLLACAHEDFTTADHAHRRMAFRGLSYIWGAQARAQLKTTIVAPNKDNPDQLDFAIVHGFYHLRKLRADAPLTIMRLQLCDHEGIPAKPICPSAQANANRTATALHLMEDFCSKPVPEFREVSSLPNFHHAEVINTGVGDTAAVSFVEAGALFNSSSKARNDKQRFGVNRALVCVPTEKLIVDFILHESIYGPLQLNASIFGNNTVMPSHDPTRSHDVLDMRQTVQNLGKGPTVLHSPDIPKYPSLARAIFKNLEWDGERFDVYRCAIDYPVVPSSVALWFELPE